MKHRPWVKSAYRAIGKEIPSDKKRREEKEKEMSKEKYVKIIAKDKDGITLWFTKGSTVDGGPQKLRTTWDEFNRIYFINPDDPFKAWLKPEVKEIYEKVDNLTTLAITHYMREKAIEMGSPESYEGEKSKEHFVMVTTLCTAASAMKTIYPEESCMNVVMENFMMRIKIFYHGIVELGGGIINKDEIKKFMSEADAKKNEENLETLKAAN